MSITLRKKKLSNGKVSLYLDIYSSGRRQFQFLNLYLTGDRSNDKQILAIAKKVEAERTLELASFRYDFHAHRQRVNFYEFAEPFINGKGPANRHIYGRFLIHFRRFAGNGITFSDINPLLCQHFHDYLLNQKLSVTSAQLYFIKLRTLLREAVRQGIIPKDPSVGITFPIKESIVKFLTLEELQLLTRTPTHGIVKAAFMFGVTTGLRYSDIVNLKWTDINNRHLYVIQKKTGRRVMIPLNAMAIRILSGLKGLSNDDRVFCLPPHRTVCYQLKSWAKKARIDKDLTFHMSRHSFATLAISSGIDIYTVSKLLGHSKLATTQIYAQVTDASMQRAVALLPEVE